MKINKILKTLVVAILFLAVFPTAAEAGFGVSPTNIFNEYLKPGAKFDRTITLSRSDPVEDLDVIIEPSLGEIESWFKFEPGLKFTFPKGATRITFKVFVEVPSTAQYRSYEGIIRVKAMKKGEDVQGVSIVKGARLDVDLVTTETNFSLLNVKSLKMLDSIDGEPLKLEIIAENQGNVEITPSAKIVIKNLQMEDLETSEASGFGSVKPNETETLTAQFNSSLPEGEYFVEASVLIGKDVVRKERLVFRINGEVKGDEKDSDKEKNVGGIKIDKSVRYVVAFIVGAIILYTLLSLVWGTKRMEKYLETNWSIYAGSRKASRVAISILLAAGIAVGYWGIENIKREEKQEVNSKTEDKQDENLIETDVELTVVTGTDVKGATDKAPVDSNGNPLVVGPKSEEGKAKYPIYRSPNIKSEIVYYASEDQELKVIEEKADWYRVEVAETSLSGWLEKASVKSSSKE